MSLVFVSGHFPLLLLHFVAFVSEHHFFNDNNDRTTYAKVAGKYQDVLTLESSVAELHQMFLDFALLTEQQGELLDQIEFQVKQAGDYVEEANVDVHEAIEIQKSIRKKQWYVRDPDFFVFLVCSCLKGLVCRRERSFVVCAFGPSFDVVFRHLLTRLYFLILLITKAGLL